MSDLDDDADDVDKTSTADDRGGVNAMDTGVERVKATNRCCTVSRRACFLVSDRVDATELRTCTLVVMSASISSRPYPLLAASARVARSTGSILASDDDECSSTEAQSVGSRSLRSCARRSLARVWRCARGRCEMESKVVEDEASTS